MTGLLVVATAATVLATLERTAPAPAPAGEASQETQPAGAQLPALPSALPERPPLGGLRGAPFASPASPAAPKPIAQAPAAPLAPPPVPYKYAGTMVREGAVQHYVVKDDAIIAVKEGDTLDGAYRVEALAAGEITLLYVPYGSRTRLLFARPADVPPAPPPVLAHPSVSPALAASLPTSQASAILNTAPPIMRAAQLKAPRTFRPPADTKSAR